MKRGRPEGFTMTAASKKKISNSKRGQRHTIETKRKIAKSLIGHHESGFTPGKLAGGYRVLASPKFNFIDGKWGADDFAAVGHQLYGICTMDVYIFYCAGILDKPIEIPKSICDRRYPNKPEMWNLRHKEQFAPGKRLWCYRDNPKKAIKLHGYMRKICNQQFKKIAKYTGTIIEPYSMSVNFYIYSFMTIAPTGERCLWKVTIKSKDEKNQPIRVPILAEIDGIDAGIIGYDKATEIAGEMAHGECEMTSKHVNSQVCVRSPLAR
jgi:hypothetical protein